MCELECLRRREAAHFVIRAAVEKLRTQFVLEIGTLVLPHVVKNVVSAVKLLEILLLHTFCGSRQELERSKTSSQRKNSLRYWFCPHLLWVAKNLVSAEKLVEILFLTMFLQVVKNLVSAEKLVEIFFFAHIFGGGQKPRLSGKTR